MRRVKTISPPKPFASQVAGVHSAQEAAARLSRLEFDVARLEREILQAEARAQRSRSELQRCIEQRESLLSIIARPSRALGKDRIIGA